MRQEQAPYQWLRNNYWQYLTEFKDNYGYMNRSHSFDNFKKFLERENVILNDSVVDVWNWYMV